MNPAVCAITITFNPELDVFERQLARLQPQCEVILVDNGSAPEILQQIESLASRYECTLLALPANAGIAAAQNHGVAAVQAQRPACAYVLFLDHDSVPGPDFVDQLLTEFARLRAIDSATGVIGPAIYEPRARTYYGFHVLDGLRYRRVDPGTLTDGAVRCATINSAGTFCPLDVMQQVGPFDAGLFIDHVETEWCFRAGAAGYTLYGTNAVELEHRMGDDVLSLKLPGKTITLPYRSPHRHQYLMRNSIAMLKRPTIPRIWKAYCLVKIVITLGLFGTVSNEPRAQRRAILAGIRDGLRNRSGPIAPLAG